MTCGEEGRREVGPCGDLVQELPRRNAEAFRRLDCAEDRYTIRHGPTDGRDQRI